MNQKIGKCIKDIPFNKITPALRVAIKYDRHKEVMLGCVLKTKNASSSITLIEDRKEFGPKGDMVVVDFDDGPIMCYDHQGGCDFLFYVEE